METPFRKNLLDLQEKRGFSWVWLAKRADINAGTLSTIVTGRNSDPKVSTALKISKVLDVSLVEMVSDKKTAA